MGCLCHSEKITVGGIVAVILSCYSAKIGGFQWQLPSIEIESEHCPSATSNLPNRVPGTGASQDLETRGFAWIQAEARFP